jgi:predicted nucleotidyltransferase
LPGSLAAAIIPNMGTKSSRLSNALFSKTQRSVLALLFGNPERSYYVNEIVRAAGVGVGAAQRELQGLAAAGLVTVSAQGNRKHYQANPDSLIYGELHGIVVKVLGAAESHGSHRTGMLPLPATLHQPQAGYVVSPHHASLDVPVKKIAALCRRYGVKKLSLFGSAARGEMNPESDVDLMVEFEPASKVSLWDMPRMQADFSALFGQRRVELVPPEVMKNPFRRKSILADLRVLYEA